MIQFNRVSTEKIRRNKGILDETANCSLFMFTEKFVMVGWIVDEYD